VRTVEHGDDPAATRRAVLEAIGRRYTPVAAPDGQRDEPDAGGV
jgi:hypothetical protein